MSYIDSALATIRDLSTTEDLMRQIAREASQLAETATTLNNTFKGKETRVTITEAFRSCEGKTSALIACMVAIGWIKDIEACDPIMQRYVRVNLREWASRLKKGKSEV